MCCASSRTCGRQSFLAFICLLIVAALLISVPWSIRRPMPATPGTLEVTVPGRDRVPSPPTAARPRLHSVPSIMMDLFHRGPHDQLQAEIVRSLTPRTIDRLNQRRPASQVWEHLHLLTLDLPRVVPGETLHSAQLRLTLTFLDTSLHPVPDVESTVRVYWGWGSGDEEAVLNQLVHDKASDKKVTFNCTDLIFKFLSLHKSLGGELQLLVGVSLAAEFSVPHTLLMAKGGDHQPLLLLLYNSPIKNLQLSQVDVPVLSARQRRDTQMEAEDYEEETNRVWASGPLRPRRTRNLLCRRRPLYVEFSEINYDSWIVAPNGYQAYQCVGKCTYPLSDHLSPTKHAIVQTLVHGANAAKTSRACCVPTRLDSISVLYLDSQGVLTYRLSYTDMVVAECGCR